MHCREKNGDGVFFWWNPSEFEENDDATASFAEFANPSVAIVYLFSFHEILVFLITPQFFFSC